MDQVKFRYILFGGVDGHLYQPSFILIYISCGGLCFDGP